MKNKEGMLRIGMSLGLIVVMYFLLTKVVTPAILNASDDFRNIFVMASVIVTAYLINAGLYAFSIEELRKVLMNEGTMFLLLLLPIKSDIVFRDYYAEVQGEVGDGNELKSIYAILPLLISIIFTLVAFIWLPFTLYREGIMYMTRELGLVAMVMLIVFTLLQLVRNVALSKIVKACGAYTYINAPQKYSIFATVITIGWALVFVVSPLLSIIGVSVSHPLINIIALVTPLTVLPLYTYRGVRSTRKDMTMDYDIDL